MESITPRDLLLEKVRKQNHPKEIDGVVYLSFDGIYLPITEKPSSREKTWITLRQITDEFPEFFDKIEDIFASKSPEYNSKAKDYSTSVMKFLELNSWISWKQFDSIWRICSTYEAYKQGKSRGYYSYGSVISIQKSGVTFTGRSNIIPLVEKATTDKEMDMLHTRIFGVPPRFEEEEIEGYSVAYDSNGTRFFALPTGEEKLEDYLSFGLSFKGLTI
jgi:hypothetical protein